MLGSGSGPLGGGVGPIRRNGELIEGGHPCGGSGPHGSGSGSYGGGHMGGNITHIRGPWMGFRKSSWNTWYSPFAKLEKSIHPKMVILYITIAIRPIYHGKMPLIPLKS